MITKTRLLLAFACATALAVGLGAPALSSARDGTPPRALAPASARMRPNYANPRTIRRFRSEAWRWESLMGRRRSRGAVRAERRILRFWHDRALRRRWEAAHPPHKGAWLCIHRYEGAWTDAGDPYWGGLQMDRGFMSTYAPRALRRRGWADRWTPIEQMWVAERAFRSGRGFYPWPNTASACGLL
jgi:hypothetical protein